MIVELASIPPGGTRPQKVRVSVDSLVAFLAPGVPGFVAISRGGAIAGGFAGDENFPGLLAELGLDAPSVQVVTPS